MNTLVAFFSATGTTAAVAAEIARVTGGELCAVTPKLPYTEADLDWHNAHSRSSVEMQNPAARPGLCEDKVNPADFEVIFIGYPIWWDEAPRAINTFIERHDWTGKTLIPFATSGSSGIANSVSALKRSYPQLNWQEGKLLNHADEAAIRRWAEGV